MEEEAQLHPSLLSVSLAPRPPLCNSFGVGCQSQAGDSPDYFLVGLPVC